MANGQDPFTPEKRREIMRSVRNSGTDIEMELRRALWHAGLRYRVNVRLGKTRPDIVFKRPRVAVFVDGCFWHGCPRHYQAPSAHAEFWSDKIEANKSRDDRNTQYLRERGWTVLRFWECHVKANLASILQDICSNVHK